MVMSRIGIDKLIAHVGCGTVDDMGCCVLCELIRARLKSLESAAKYDAVDPVNRGTTDRPRATSSPSPDEQQELPPVIKCAKCGVEYNSRFGVVRASDSARICSYRCANEAPDEQQEAPRE